MVRFRQNRMAPDIGKYSPPGSSSRTRPAISGLVRVIRYVAGVIEQFARDGNHMVGRLARAEYDFGDAVAQGAVVVDLGEAQVFERQVPHAVKRRIDIRRPAAHVFEQGPQSVFCRSARHAEQLRQQCDGGEYR